MMKATHAFLVTMAICLSLNKIQAQKTNSQYSSKDVRNISFSTQWADVFGVVGELAYRRGRQLTSKIALCPEISWLTNGSGLQIGGSSQV